MKQIYCKPWAFVTSTVTKAKQIRFAIMLASCILLNTRSSVHAQVTLSADGPGDTYALIESKGFGIESPDCKHPSFGPHVTEVFDNTLNKNVFVFHSHPVLDDDRCTNEDRVRMEIKGGSGSPAAMQHTQGQTAYYRWKFKLDAGFIPSSRFTHIFQIKAIDGDDGAPLITITPRAGTPQKLQIIHSAGEGSGSLGTIHQVDLAPFKGTWVEVFVTYKSSDGSAGTFSITIKRVSDGATLLSYSKDGIDMWREGASYNRPKWGVYRGKDDVLRDEQVRFADFCISETSATQCPSDAGNGGGGETTNLPATQDAYVRDGTNAGTAFGASDAASLVTKVSPEGQLNNNRETYLTFNTAAITGTIASGTVRIYGRTEDDRDANVPVGLYAVSNTTWSESTITWNNKPAAAASPLASATVTDATGRYYTWNITNYLISERAAGRSTVSFVLKNAQTTTGRLLWNSKETGSNAPQLAVTTASSISAAMQTNETAKSSVAVSSFPNPFNDVNTITFTLDQPAHVQLAVYDLTGKQVALLLNANLQAGLHKKLFAAKQLPSGLYMIRLVYGNKRITQKILKE